MGAAVETTTSSSPNYDSVGEWAFDLIELTDKRPKDYSVYDITFTGQRAAA